MEERAGLRISTRAFVQSALILLALMLAGGVLTLVVPAGSYTRLESQGRQVIDPDSYQALPRPEYPVWRWLTAPVEVLGGPDGLTILTIVLFLLCVGVSFTVLDASGILRTALARVVAALGGRKYALLLGVALFFMLLGAVFGIFEEVVPLVPLVIALSYSLGWDSLVGLGMSILATNIGFSAALTNPFTIGVAQRLAGLPLFSGIWLRIPIFLVFYAILAVFLVGYARRVERAPQSSPVYADDERRRAHGTGFDSSASQAPMGRALIWFLVFLALILVVLISAPFVSALSDYSLPLVGLLFLVAGLGAGWLSGAGGRVVGRAAWQGMLGIAPAIPLILMAASVKHIVSQGGVIDTILHSAAQSFGGVGPLAAVLGIYLLTLLIEVFVGSASAKAFLLMPILLPLADLIGVTRQVTVLAYCFGDGFSNLAYPTNPVLLISLGLTVVSYPQWIRWTAKLWLWILLLTVGFLALAVAIGFGPF